MSTTPRDGGPVIDPEDPTGPGAQLREARHRANLSLEEVATQLRLDRRTVRALEDNEFQYLPAPTFIRGYIRSYARLLGLPPGPILEAYDYQGFTPPAIMADITQGPQARFSDFPVRLATYVVAAGLVAMVVMWWHSRESTPEAPEEVELVANLPEDPAATPAGASSGSASSQEQQLPEPPAPPAEELIAVEVAQNAQPEAVPSSAPPIVSSAPESLVHQLEVPSEPASPESASAATPAREPAVDAAGNAATNRTVTVREALITAMETPPPPGRLVIRFSDESWVEIFDADGIRREFRLATPGSRTSVSGTPPFNVLLGFAEGALVTFDGRDYDITRFIRGDTARFLIGPDGLAKARPRQPPPEPPQSSAIAESEPPPVTPEAAASQPSASTSTPATN
jgi:cytoskeleton protein RodZ